MADLLAEFSAELIGLELSPEIQGALAVLAGHALKGMEEALAERHPSQRQHRAMMRLFDVREFCAAALVCLSDASISNERIVAAAKEHGRRTARTVMDSLSPRRGATKEHGPATFN